MEKMNTKKALAQIEQNKLSSTSKELSIVNKRSEALLSVFGEASAFATKFNLHGSLTRYRDYRTPKEAFEGNFVRLREISGCYGQEKTQAWIAAWLVTLSSYMDFEISTEQAMMTAQFLYEELYMLNLAEFTLFFKRIQKGRYGRFFGKFNGQIIMDGAIEYRKERGQILSKMSTNEQNKYK